MSLDVLIPARLADRLLLTRTAAKVRLGIDAGETGYDQLLDWLLEEAGDAIDGTLGRPLVRQRYSETLSSDGSVELVLSRYPLEPSTLEVVDEDGEDLDGVKVSSRDQGIIWWDRGWESDVGSRAGFPSTGRRGGRFGDYELGGTGEPSYTATYWAGHVPPTRVVTWTAAGVQVPLEATPRDVVLGDWVRPAGQPLWMEATTAGAVGASEPDWPTAAGETVADGAAVWTARDATELPRRYTRACWLAVLAWYGADGRDPGLVSETVADTVTLRYASGRGPRALPEDALELLEAAA